MESYPTKSNAITTWAEEDRPREKLLAKGKQSLSDAELLAILLGSGSREQTAVGLAKSILHSTDYNLNILGRRTLAELMTFKGIGEAKAITIQAALELGRRRQLSAAPTHPKITSSRDAYEVLATSLMDLPHEECWILLLSQANKVLERQQISSGGTTGTVVDTRVLFRRAIQKERVVSLILAHNHPSGNLKPSQMDIELTRKIKKAGELIGIKLLDHLIITDNGYYSFADEGML